MHKEQNMRHICRGFRFRRLTAMFIAILLILSGCSVEPVPVMKKQIEWGAENTAASGGAMTLQDTMDIPLLSKGVCIIPRGSDSATDPAITASAALLVNDTKHKVLYAQDVYSRQYPASVSKIATALLALKYGNMSDTVTISHEAANITEYGAKLCGFAEGDQISMKNLMIGMLVYSGNDAAVAIAEHISGSEEAFVEKMNQEMISIGASDSHFTNANGLYDEEHYTTAYDLYLIFHRLLKYKKFLKIIQTKEQTITWKSAEGTERSLNVAATDAFMNGTASLPEGISVIGGKSGTSVKAGSCMVLCTQDSKKKKYISIILKADSAYSLNTQISHLLEKTSKNKEL